MDSIETVSEQANFNFEEIVEELFWITGLFILFFGSFGLVLSITLYPLTRDQVFNFEMIFVYSYMIVLGAFLIIYHKRILIKSYIP